MKPLKATVCLAFVALVSGCISTESQQYQGRINTSDAVSDNNGRAPRHNSSVQSGGVYSPYSNNVKIKLPGRAYFPE